MFYKKNTIEKIQIDKTTYLAIKCKQLQNFLKKEKFRIIPFKPLI